MTEKTKGKVKVGIPQVWTNILTKAAFKIEEKDDIRKIGPKIYGISSQFLSFPKWKRAIPIPTKTPL